MSFLYRNLPILAAGLVLAASMASATTPPKDQPSKSKTHTSKLHKSSHRGKKSRKPRGQQAIDTQRTHEIQAALLREHYLTSEPSGTWDASTQAAMRKYQADQGWQTKVIPDSRALIRLGLGPSREHLLNPESAMVSGSAVQSARVGTASRATVLPASNSSPGMQVNAGSDLSSAR
ncbi:MAG TPA: peptidoglycan-binding domain-containing protein [Terriglobales bacterium]|nr:peptidoglycan-binding domain-containing protein [Terriglobales bacterium]